MINTFVDVHADLHILGAADRAEFLQPLDFLAKADTPGAMNAACHVR